MTEDEMVEWHQQLDGHEFEQALGVGDIQGSLACCSPWGHKELDMAEQLHFHFSRLCIGKEMATHSSVLAWRIPGMGLHRVGHD